MRGQRLSQLGLGFRLTALFLPLPAAGACDPGTVTGEVTFIRDGDTIELGPLAIRLNGLAAPERGELGADAAMKAMVELVANKVVRCELDGSATYDRCAGICYLDGADIAEELVAMGLARDCPRYSGGRHAEAEHEAAERGATIGERYGLPGYCRPDFMRNPALRQSRERYVGEFRERSSSFQ